MLFSWPQVRHYPDLVREDAAAREGAEYTVDGKLWPRPTEVLLAPGDAAVVLYHVPHNATRNCSDDVRPDGRIVPRLQCYARVTNGRRPSPHKPALLDLWSDWDGLQGDLPRLRAERELALLRTAAARPAAALSAAATPVWGQAAKL